jgi:hypothetical protein
MVFQMPNGLFGKDIDMIQQLTKNYGIWRNLFQLISSNRGDRDQETPQGPPELVQQVAPSQSKQFFKMMDSYFHSELEDC